MENFDPNIVFLWRALERFANVLIGAVAIYLGYKLFMNLPERREETKGEMKLLLPGDISVYVSRVGPGVFFALFGTVVVLMSFASPLRTQLPATTPGPQPVQKSPGTSASISYVTGKTETDRFSTDRAGVQRDLVALRGLEGALNEFVETGDGPKISANEANTLLNTLQRIKRSLLLSVWDDTWGDPERFSQWVQEGAIGPPPSGTEDVAKMFTVPLKEVKQ